MDGGSEASMLKHDRYITEPTEDPAVWQVVTPQGDSIATIYANGEVRGVMLAQAVADKLTARRSD